MTILPKTRDQLLAENALLKDRLQVESTKRAMALHMTRKLILARQGIDKFLEQVCKHAIVEPGSERSLALLRKALEVLARPLAVIPESSSPNSPTSSTDSSSTAPSEASPSTPPKSQPPSSPG